MTARRWLHGLGAGLVAGVIDAGLIRAVEPGGSPWVLAEALLFWTTAGWAVVASESGLGSLAHGVVATLLLNLPWFVLLGPAAGKPLHLPPLIAMSALFGAGFGWAHRRARAAPSPTPPASGTAPSRAPG